MKKIKLYFDLDGVIRELNQHILGHQPNEWEGLDGNLLVYTIHKNPKILLETTPTEYYHTILRASHAYHFPIHILSHQPKQWQPYTTAWIKTYLQPFTDIKTIYTESSAEKRTYIDDAKSYLIEDCPTIADHPRVVLLDKPYNRDVVATYRRIYDPQELEDWFRATYES